MNHVRLAIASVIWQFCYVIKQSELWRTVSSSATKISLLNSRNVAFIGCGEISCFMNIRSGALFIHQWLCSPFIGKWQIFFGFVISYTVGRIPWAGDQPVAKPLATHRRAQTQNKRKQPSMPRAGFEHMKPAFERAKEVHASDHATTVNGNIWCLRYRKLVQFLVKKSLVQCRFQALTK
jgi:hypothetical protein